MAACIMCQFTFLRAEAACMFLGERPEDLLPEDAKSSKQGQPKLK